MNDQASGRSTKLRRYVVMGISGSGKSEIGRRLAKRLGIVYVEGDEHHSPQSIAKMAAGTPLDDHDRHDWLLTLQSLIAEAAQQNKGMVLTCSALKRRYRDLLRAGDPALVFIYLHGDQAMIASRMKQRTGHFMPEALLESQLLDLEPPGDDERVVRVDVAASPEEIVDQVMEKIATI
jgi:gluconokinase